ncbi:MAG: preprotein translocase subunit SecA [Puniceicoccales bacterium]|jgi:preprotein translocase subunit SecA|nr:preprotein translocase subunit SecA [Puniceicoccales bacterium]
MIGKIFKMFAGRHYRKFLKKCQPTVARINEIEAEYQGLSDEQLRAKTDEFRARLSGGERLDEILPEAFAAVKNTARRLCGTICSVCGHDVLWDMVHYDVQLVGGMALHQGKIAEMATGEGKTLVATLPLYLNALTGKNCQLVTVNDYLALRDATMMGYLYKFLGLSVGCLQNEMESEERKAAYLCDITYGTASEFGFDYLRDNGTTSSAEEQVQRGHFFCIVDEIDSILIDEARTPLIISGSSDCDDYIPFLKLKPDVERLVSLQQKLCNRLVSEAKSSIESGKAEKDAYKKLWQVKLGMPRNKQFLKLMEDGEVRKRFDKFDLEMSSEFARDERYKIKEELYYCIDEKGQQSDLTEIGRRTVRPDDPNAFLLPDLPTIFSKIDSEETDGKKRVNLKREAEELFSKISAEIHCLSQLLRAYSLYNRDEQYAVIEGKVVIIDENTGRAMAGRRWSEGLHQAIEAKEGLEVEGETKTYATITLQNYFRMYEKLAGMTGTAETEAQEFNDIYKLNVVVIPTNRPCQRVDLNDCIYKTRREKYNAVIGDIKSAHEKGQPVLVGTTSVEASELLSKMLKRDRIRHNVLNAKYHAKEADIIAQAGQKFSVTIATNMAGRGTDIKLEKGVNELGGLLVLGTERHESRRIDRQLRGRCARQGDHGSTKFFVSLEDNLMRLFAGSGPIAALLHKTFHEGEVLEHPLLNKSIQTAQKKVEEYHYGMRKRLLQYDNVLNKQREVIYSLRNDILHSDSPKAILFELICDAIGEKAEEFLVTGDVQSFIGWVNSNFPIVVEESDLEGLATDAAISFIEEKIKAAYALKEETEDPESIRTLECFTVLRSIDRRWQDHLTEMDQLRNSVGLRGYGQRDPLNEYKNEAFSCFETTLKAIRSDVCFQIFRLSSNKGAFHRMVEKIANNFTLSGAGAEQSNKTNYVPKVSVSIKAANNVGRNELCPCGSGKKYKKCCGRG